MSYNLTITAVSPNSREWSSTHGSFKDYTITVKNEASGNTRDVSWSRKRRGDGTYPSPQVGDQLEADMIQSDFPPNWKLKNVKFANGDPSTSVTNGRSSWTGPQQDQGEFRRSKEQMTREAADNTAALLMIALGSGGPWNSTDEFWEQFNNFSTQVQLRAVFDAKPEPAPQALPENRKDIERTGESDVPLPEHEFAHAPAADDETIPF